VSEKPVKGDAAETDDDAEVDEEGDFLVEPGGAVALLLGGGLVVGRGAADDGVDPEIAELDAVVAVSG